MPEPLVIVGSRRDPEANALVARWSAYGARLLSCEDLSTPGWTFDPECPSCATAVVDGEIVASASIAGVLTRRPAIFESELGHLAAPDRAYMASEMNAFLFAWLTSLSCPVLNTPRLGCLMGPAWTSQQWQWAAHRAGLRIGASDDCAEKQGTGAAAPAATIEVTIVAGTVVNAPDAACEFAVERLADLAQVQCLSVELVSDAGGLIFLSADACPKIGDPVVADLLIEALQRSRLAS